VTLDAGQLIVELKVAPSRPLAFITVRLVGEADSGFRVDAR
jgi:phage tail sheath protein FI